MNLNRIHESQRRLNYYSRSSPKKKQNINYNQSPLISTNINSNNKMHNVSMRSFRSSQNTSFRINMQEVKFSNSYNQILIEQSDDQAILIEDPVSQESIQNDQKMIFIDNNQQKYPFKQGQGGKGSGRGRLIKNNDIRIQDDQNIELDSQHYDNSQQQSIEQNYIKIQNQQLVQDSMLFEEGQQTMNRQFTFGYELAERKRKQRLVSLPITKEQSYSNKNSSQNQSEQHNNSMNHFESNMEYEMPQPQKKPILGLDINLIDLSSEPVNAQDYQSPTFNTVYLNKTEDQWSIAKHERQLQQEKSKEKRSESPKPSNHSSTRLKLIMRPYGNSIMLLNQIMPQIPEQLSKVYEKMHKKLISDQINAQQKLQKQQKQIKLMRILTLLRRKHLKCQQFLLSPSQSKDQQIQINRIIIHSLIKQILS